MGYTSHQAGTCSLHAHISRAAFGMTEAEQDASIARVLFFAEKNWEELLKFSRRTPRQPKLVQYLKERRLYINEPVEGEVEV